MAFGLFILVNITLFIRPAEIVPDLAELPIYQILILACLALSWNRVLAKLTTLHEQPITLCIVGLWFASILSHMARFDTWTARQVALDFGRVVLYFLLLISLVDSTARLRQFLAWLLVSIAVTATLAVLLYHNILHLPGMKVIEDIFVDKETGLVNTVPRLCGSGIFNDPNDLCLALTMGILLSLFWLGEPSAGFMRFFCLIPTAVCGYALTLTESRGGLLGLMIGLFVLMAARFGWRRTLPLAVLLIPAALIFIGGRQANIEVGAGTGQARVQLWSEGLVLWRAAPLFGIGSGLYAEQVGQVAHNSFVHAFVELGFFGGTLFVGAFFLAMAPLVTLVRTPNRPTAADARRLPMFLLAILAGYAGGLWSLSRNYIEPTYMVLALAQVGITLTGARVPLPAWRPGLLPRLGWVGAASLVFLYVFTRATVSYG